MRGRDAALVAGSLAVALVAGEAGLRLTVGPPASFIFPRSFRDVQTDFDVTYGTLPDGRRRVCGSPEKDAVRVAVLGDSFVFGQGVADCRDFTSLLAEEMPDVRFENFGSIGAGIQDYLLVARDLLGSRFDRVVLVLYGNDVSEVRIDRSLAGRIADRLSLAALVRRAWYRHEAERQLAEAARGGNGLVRTLDGKLNNILSTLALDPGYYRIATDPPPAKREEFSKEFRELAARLVARVGAGNVLVAVVPEGHVVSGRLRSFLRESGGEVAPDGERGGAYELIRALSAECGLTFVETFDAFRPGDDLYFPHDLHWTEAGQARMAEVLRPWLVRGP